MNNSAGTLNINSMDFRSSGFTISGGTLAFSGVSASTIALSNGVTAAISSALAGTNRIDVLGSSRHR